MVHGALRADGFVERIRLLKAVVLHGEIVGMIVGVDVGNRHAVLVLSFRVQRDAIGFARQVFADDPHAREIHVVINHRGAVAAPFAGQQVCREAWQTLG